MTRILIILLSIPAVPLLAVMAAITTFVYLLFHGWQMVWEKA